MRERSLWLLAPTLPEPPSIVPSALFPAHVVYGQCSCNSRAASLPRRQTELTKDNLSDWKNPLLTLQILKAASPVLF